MGHGRRPGTVCERCSIHLRGGRTSRCVTAVHGSDALGDTPAAIVVSPSLHQQAATGSTRVTHTPDAPHTPTLYTTRQFLLLAWPPRPSGFSKEAHKKFLASHMNETGGCLLSPTYSLLENDINNQLGTLSKVWTNSPVAELSSLAPREYPCKHCTPGVIRPRHTLSSACG